MSVAEVVAQMQAEALEWGRLRGLARTESMQSASRIPVRGREESSHEAMSLIQDRDPCGQCGTRKDWHDEFGCKRWRAGG